MTNHYHSNCHFGGEHCLPQHSHLTPVHYAHWSTNTFFSLSNVCTCVKRGCDKGLYQSTPTPMLFLKFHYRDYLSPLDHKVADAKKVEGEKNKMVNVPLPSAWCPFRSSNAASGSACHSSWPVCSSGCPSDEPPETTQDTETQRINISFRELEQHEPIY